VLAALPASATGTSYPGATQESGDTAVVVAAAVDAQAGTDDVDDLADVAAQAAAEVGGTVRVSDEVTGIVSVEVPAHAAADVADELAAEPVAETVSRPAEFTLWRWPRDPRIADQRSYLRQIQVPRAWNRTRGSAGTTVAVIDSGVATSHPDLRGRIVDRYNGVDGSRDVADNVGHGTAVASVAAATANNRRGIAGVAWRSSVLAVKVADRQGRIFGDALAAGIRWSVDQGVDVINLSLGSPSDDRLVRAAVAEAVAADVVVVAAVSNSAATRAVYPAAYPGVVSVAATRGPRLAPFSDRGRFVDVAAPGVGLKAAVPGGYARVDGTSFAAALVSGQAALVRSVVPAMRAERVRTIISGTTRRVGTGPRSADRVHVFASVRRAIGVPTPPRAVNAVPRATSVVVTWRPPAASGRSSVTRYRVDVRRIAGTWTTRAVVDADQRQVRLSRLRPASRYQVKVIALNDQGVGVHSRAVPVRPR
jgi:subtilisin family serine protease